VEFDLPSVAAADVGAWFRFVNTTTGGRITIDANDSDTIAESAAGGTLHNDNSEDYATVEILLATETKWVITGAHGTWVAT
jgi:hypothetical protein